MTAPGSRLPRRLATGVVRRVCRAVLRVLGVRVTLRGAAPRTPVLFVANHLSWLDILAVLARLDCTFVAKQEVRGWPIVNWLGVLLGVVWIDRTRKRDLLQTIPALEARLRSGVSVFLFAEGTTSDGHTLLPFKSALVEAAVRAGVPVVPIALTASACPPTDALCWTGRETLIASIPRVWALSDAALCVHAAPAIPTEPSRKAMTAKARAAIAVRTAGGAIRARDPATVSTRRGTGHQRPSVSRSAVDGALRSIAGFLVALAVGVSLLYAQSPIYEFAAPAPFRGATWYNPYAAGDSAGGRWLRANLHAHAKAWGGLSAGRQPDADVARRYRALGYDVVGISNYHAHPSRRAAGTFPVYEHGWNVSKGHRLAIGATDVLWLDYPLGATRHQQQYLIDRLHATSALVAIAHPALRQGHSPSDLRSLGNYELLEVFNHFLPPADSAWDAALSSGRPIWILANDDSHDVTGAGETGTNFTRIFAADTGASHIVEALRAGRAYGVRTTHRTDSLTLGPMTMRGDTLQVVLRGALKTVRIVGQNGATRRWWKRTGNGARDTVVTLTAVAQPADGYLRVVAEGEGILLYTNPVVRWDGRALPLMFAIPNPPRSVLWHASWLLGYAWLAAWLIGGSLLDAEQRRRGYRPVTERP